MNIIIFGPPGAGKGTQSKKIINDFNLEEVSTGDLLRNEIKFQTEVGKKAELLINKGELVSDELVNKLIEKIISNPKNFNKLIFDGYPRTLSQVSSLDKILEKFNQKISIVLSLEVEENIVSKRITGRIICDKCSKVFNIHFNPPNIENHQCDEKFLRKRPDDNIQTIIHRFKTYVSKTEPILNYYKKKGSLREINGNREIDEIYNEIRGILDNIRH